MFYKYENGEWFIGAKIYFPDGTILSLKNKIEKDGWMWHDEPPREYLEWFQKNLLNSQNERI
jgi:hypothetical protein